MRITCNGEIREVAEGSTVEGVLSQMGVDPRRVAVELNQQVVPRSQQRDRPLHEGDQLEVVTLVGGG